MVDALLVGQEQRSFVVPFSQNGFELDDAGAYAEQDKFVGALLRGRESSVVGYKIAYASDTSRVRAGVSGPVYGQLLDTMRVPEGGSVVLAGYRRFAAEAEVALVIDRTIDEPVQTVEDIRGYVGSVHIALDLPDVPFDYEASFTGWDMVVANTGAYRFALGPSRDPLRVDFGQVQVVLSQDGRAYSRGAAGEVLGGPYHALLWLQQQLATRGRTLEAGQVVLTGAPGRPLVQSEGGADLAGTYSASAGPLGTVRVVVR